MTQAVLTARFAAPGFKSFDKAEDILPPLRKVLLPRQTPAQMLETGVVLTVFGEEACASVQPLPRQLESLPFLPKCWGRRDHRHTGVSSPLIPIPLVENSPMPHEHSPCTTVDDDPPPMYQL